MDLEYPFFMVITGRPGQGKTTATNFFIMQGCELGKWKYGNVISPTEDLNENYGEYLPSDRIFSTWDPLIISNLIEFQKKAAREKNIQPCFLAVDDGVGSVQFGHKVWTELATTWRQLKISVIVDTQWINKLPLLFKECSSYAVLFNPGQTSQSIEATYKFCGGTHFENAKQWKNFLLKKKGKHCFIFQDKNGEEVDPNKQFKKCKVHYPLKLTRVKY